jgi:hypothetical protein
MGASSIGLTTKANREGRVEQQHVFDRVALFLTAITARLLRRILGAPDAPFSAIMPNRGAAGAWADAGVGGADGSAAPAPARPARSRPSRPPRGASRALSQTGWAHPPARAASSVGYRAGHESTDEPCSGPCRRVVPARLGAERSSGRPGYTAADPRGLAADSSSRSYSGERYAASHQGARRPCRSGTRPQRVALTTETHRA